MSEHESNDVEIEDPSRLREENEYLWREWYQDRIRMSDEWGDDLLPFDEWQATVRKEGI